MRLPFKENSFDCIHMEALLHHIVGRSKAESKNKAAAAILEARRVLKPGGFLLLTELYFESVGVLTLTSSMLFAFLHFF